jgi:hypothetical protein
MQIWTGVRIIRCIISPTYLLYITWNKNILLITEKNYTRMQFTAQARVSPFQHVSTQWTNNVCLHNKELYKWLRASVSALSRKALKTFSQSKRLRGQPIDSELQAEQTSSTIITYNSPGNVQKITSTFHFKEWSYLQDNFVTSIRN